MAEVPFPDPDERREDHESSGHLAQPLGDVTPLFDAGAVVGEVVSNAASGLGDATGAIGEGLVGAAGEAASGCGGCSLVLLAGFILAISGGVAIACS